MKRVIVSLFCMFMLMQVNAFAENINGSIFDQTNDFKQNSAANFSERTDVEGVKHWNETEITWEKPKHCPVLTYHHFILNPEWAGSWTTTPDKFENDIKTLLSNGYTFITTDQWLEGQKEDGVLPEKPVILQFDDGYTSVYELAFPILYKYNVPAEIYILTNTAFETPHSINNNLFLSWPQMKIMEDSGLISIHIHGKTHEKATSITLEQLAINYKDAEASITENLGPRKLHYVYPEGAYNVNTLKTIKEAGSDVQFVWAWQKVEDCQKYNVMYRMNVAHTSDVMLTVNEFYRLVGK